MRRMPCRASSSAVARTSPGAKRLFICRRTRLLPLSNPSDTSTHPAPAMARDQPVAHHVRVEDAAPGHAGRKFPHEPAELEGVAGGEVERVVHEVETPAAGPRQPGHVLDDPARRARSDLPPLDACGRAVRAVVGAAAAALDRHPEFRALPSRRSGPESRPRAGTSRAYPGKPEERPAARRRRARPRGLSGRRPPGAVPRRAGNADSPSPRNPEFGAQVLQSRVGEDAVAGAAQHDRCGRTGPASPHHGLDLREEEPRVAKRLVVDVADRDPDHVRPGAPDGARDSRLGVALVEQVEEGYVVPGAPGRGSHQRKADRNRDHVDALGVRRDQQHPHRRQSYPSGRTAGRLAAPDRAPARTARNASP